MIVVCDICLIQFQQTYQKEKRCSEQCRRRFKKNKANKKKTQKQKAKIAARNALPQTCQQCQSQFITNRKKKYCSNKCMNDTSKPCSLCETMHLSKKYDVCITCRDVLKMPKEIKKQIKYGNCKECGKTFALGVQRAFCSSQCYKRYDKRAWPSNYRRRARKYGVAFDSSVTLVSALQRFDYVCGICDEMVIATQNDSSNPEQAVLDHIVAMAAGGSHTWDNVQIAHRRCNTDKLVKVDMPLILANRRTHT